MDQQDIPAHPDREKSQGSEYYKSIISSELFKEVKDGI